MNRDPDGARERGIGDKEKKLKRDSHNVREGTKGKDHDRQHERDREENRRSPKDDRVPRDPHGRESAKGVRRSRRANDDHSSARSFLSDSASSFDSFSQQSRNGSTSSNREEIIRGGHTSPRRKMSRSKDKLKSYLPSDERTRSKQSRDLRSPSTISSKQKIDLRKSRTEGSGKHTKSWTEKDLSEAQSHHSRNSEACNESFSEKTGAAVAKNVILPEKTQEESKNEASNAIISVAAEPSSETGRLVAQDKNGAIGGAERANDEHVVSGPDPPSNGKRSRNRRVALTSILDSDVGGEREADILSLCSSYSKPLVPARTSYHSELFIKVPDDCSNMISSDRHDLIYDDSGTGVPWLHHLEQVVPNSSVDKPQECRNTANDSSSSFNHDEITVTKQINETDHNHEYHDENVTVVMQADYCEPAFFDVADDEAKVNLVRDGTSNKVLQSHEIDSQAKQYYYENDKLSANSETFDDALSIGGEEPLLAVKETEQSEMTASFKEDKPEKGQTGTSPPPANLGADKDMDNPRDWEKMQQDYHSVDFEGQVNPDKSSNQSYMTNRLVHDDKSEKSLELELPSETKIRLEGPDDSTHDVSSTRDVGITSSATHPRKQRNNLATTAIDSANQESTSIVDWSRDKSHESAGAWISCEVTPSEPSQNSILSSPVSSRGRDRSRKSVKGSSKKGDEHKRTNLRNKQDHHDASDNRSLSPIRRNSENRVSSDASSRDSKISSWRPPKPNEMGTDESNKTLQMRRRRSSRRMDSHREVNKNDATSVEYDEEDVFTLYKWSGNRQDESKIRGERLALRKSIKALSFLSAFETVGI
ncbi:hypothetical protein FisN_8Lu192 [Fistulifera solaris]|uniref:Uncharacterized protein n=1 Tax=Fistulifera solaris TaxID=1519565 RepID=A0A1Z5JNB7_FISSO|nr:hypothetical protein FisN_8Lu192 [Fistulifera solaris]|eukprot:GAX15510.1 hypothetical protein FisN_8Lu192 [Fistulifera solaris]